MMMIDAAVLRDVGEALYGATWQSDLARDLNVADRTLRRWIAGSASPPQGVAPELLRLCMERAQLLDALAERIRPMAAIYAAEQITEAP